MEGLIDGEDEGDSDALGLRLGDWLGEIETLGEGLKLGEADGDLLADADGD